MEELVSKDYKSELIQPNATKSVYRLWLKKVFTSSVINDALDQYIDLHQWQLAHIEKGVKAAKKGDFASDKEVGTFFKKYGRT